jgi:hypothetical protein
VVFLEPPIDPSEISMTFKFNQAACYLISLEERSDRRDQFIHNVNEMGFDEDQFHWIVAIKDEDFGGLGCAKSHLVALTEFITRTNLPYCCIIEDDFQFRISNLEVESLINSIDTNHNWDVIMLAGTQTIGIPTSLKTQNHEIQILFQANSSSGYILKRNYAHKLIMNMLACISGMEKFRHLEPRSLIYKSFALDQMWKNQQHQDNWVCTKPMIGYQTAGYSDIEKKDVDYLNNSQ